MANKIVWLASYPKSGNTWFRLFLTALLNDFNECDINSISTAEIASSRNWFDHVVGYDSGELCFDEIDRLRPDVYRFSATRYEKRQYHKIHDAYVYNDLGQPLFPPDVTDCVVYLLRNPFDVSISFAHHKGHKRYDEMLMRMSDPKLCMAYHLDKQPVQLRQRLLTWGEHFTSWTKKSGLSVFVMRYEKMCLEPLTTFREAIRFLGLGHKDESILKALEACAFERLQAQEKREGFRERWSQKNLFFHTGKIGNWHGKLSNTVTSAFIKANEEVLLQTGYIDANSRFVY